MVEMNGQPRGLGAPFGGMKQSGNGREGGKWGIEDFLEVKAVSGWTPTPEMRVHAFVLHLARARRRDECAATFSIPAA